LSQIGNAAYSATKHAAVSFAQSLAIEHGDDGIGVSVVCPQYVATPLIGLSDGDAQTTNGVMTSDAVAECIVDGVRERRFMILPHPEVHGFFCKRAENPDRWIKGMQKLRRSSGDPRDAFSRGFFKPA
jgi:short-subunit dehydrogenase